MQELYSIMQELPGLKDF